MFARLGQWRLSPAQVLVRIAPRRTPEPAAGRRSSEMAGSSSGAAGGVARAASTTSSSSSSGGSQYVNRLGSERSPYLLQHASNPVGWYPWGEEAFSAARRDDKLIFLSIGYSTCHWCHVMERESFEDVEVARLLNENFIPVKVDREERPDVDKIYMTYVQVTSGSGGWPLSVWLTPQLEPVFGGTYFPRDDHAYGRPGFKTILSMMHDKWNSDKRDKMTSEAGRITRLLKRAANVAVNEEAVEQFNPTQCVGRCFEMLERNFDHVHGGFDRAPKFPQCVNASFLLTLHMAKGDLKAFNMVERQLVAMSRGGIHDHLAGGFHRYSVDVEWHVPHFEKMLYDQAQLLGLYSLAARIATDRDNANTFREVARSIADYVNRDISYPEGGFYSAEDADSFATFGSNTSTSGSNHKREGAFYVWTWSEIHKFLSEIEAKVFCEYFCVDEQGNVDPHVDPHGELLNQNVLINRSNAIAVAQMFDMTEADVQTTLESAKRKLLKQRLESRPRPHLDNKIVTAWNGLMISGLAKAARCLERPEYAERALKAVRFLRKHSYDSKTKSLFRSVYTEGERDCARVVQLEQPIAAVLDDYVFLIQGLLDLYDATMDESLLLFARELQERQDDLFWDSERGGYYQSAKTSPQLIFSIKDDQDGAEPSANSVTLANLVRLDVIFNNEKFRLGTSKLIKLFADRLVKIPMALPEMVSSVLRHSSSPVKVILSSPSGNVSSMKAVCDRVLHPFMVVLRAHPSSMLAIDADFPPVSGQTTAYVCKDFACQPPTTDEHELLRVLQHESAHPLLGR